LIDLIVVGVGDHYRQILGPSIDALQKQRYSRLFATVDVKPLNQPFGTDDVPHLLRGRDQPLSDVLRGFEKDDPLIYLAHAHTWHTRDAVELTRSGFRVAIEKPYAISMEEMQGLGKCVNEFRDKTFLSEYYLIKSAPLFHAFNMLTPDSFLHRESGFLTPGPARLSLDPAGLAGAIGAIQFVYLDILEGEGETGSFEHRGDEYADRRRGGEACGYSSSQTKSPASRRDSQTLY
jgi:hypothetical protein